MLQVKHCLSFFGDLGQALLERSYLEDVILARNSNNYVRAAFIQGDSAGGSKLIEQTLQSAKLVAVFCRPGRDFRTILCKYPSFLF